MESNDLYSIFMDSKLIRFEINYSDYVDTTKNVIITVYKNNSLKTVEFYKVHELIIVEEEFHQYYIGDMKCLSKGNDLFYLCLDPYDGRKNIIEQEDNFVIVFETFKVIA